MKSLIVCGENYVNANCSITVSSGDATKARLYDQRPSTRWGSNGSSEGATETIQVDFKDRLGTAVSRSIDRLIVLNHNLTNFYIEYWNGTAWTAIAEAVFTTNAETNNYIELAAPISTQKIRLTTTNTIGAVADKLVGELKACLFKVLVRHVVTIDRRNWDDGGAYRLQGGPLVTFRNLTKFEGETKMEQVSLASYEILEPLITARSWMTWIFYQDFRLADIYEVAAATPLSEYLDRKTYQYSLAFQAKER